MAANDTTWTETAIADLRRLWNEGHSTAEIGRRLGVSKNAVIGKAHRLELPPRSSPIRRAGQPARRSAPRPRAAPLVQLLPIVLIRVAPVLLSPSSPAGPCRQVLSQPCCWPLGEPGTPGFRFCDAAADEGKPYCPEHCALAYVKKPRPVITDEGGWMHLRE